MQTIIMSALIVFLPLIIVGLVAMWRDHQYEKEKEQEQAESKTA